MTTATSLDALDALASAAAAYRPPEPAVRAAFLEAAGEEIVALGEDLLAVCHDETHLGVDRLRGERTRTINQLGSFAALVREGSWVDARLDPARPERRPQPRPDLRRLLVPLGPVAVFGASNFPLAFSVAGGDTASALAAGCAVLVKPHPAHPRTSRLVAGALGRAAARLEVPAGAFTLLEDDSVRAGLALTRHPAVRAVGFTGSAAAGRALCDAAAARPEPIPVFAEMSSLNPVFALPAAVRADGGERLAAGLAASVGLGAGQFCTKPGLVFALATRAAGFEAFCARLADHLARLPAAPLLTPEIAGRFAAAVAERERDGLVRVRGAGGVLLQTDAAGFRRDARLRHELFGPATVVVGCADAAQMVSLARDLDGQLTATIHAGADDPAPEGGGAVAAEGWELARALAEVVREKAGRLVWDAFPTGVEVGPAMQHGGPWPASSDARFTSVGTAAVARFARPVCYQNFPERLLPEELWDRNVRGIWRLVDGERTRRDLP